MADYNDCILFLLAKAYQKAHGVFKKRLREHGLTPVQALILSALWEEEGLSAGEVGKRLLLDNATVSGLLDRMAEAAWLVKETDGTDRRVLRVYPTPKAKRLKSVLQEEREAVNEEVMSRLSLEEKLLLKRLLRDLQA